MFSYKLTWSGDKHVLEAVEELLTEALAPAPDATSRTKENDSAEDDMTKWRLEAYFTEAPDIAAVNALLAGTGAAQAAPEELPDIDWVAHALEGLGIVRAGRFLLYGIHDTDKVPDDSDIIPIRIDANQAFGTGHHPTTEGCLTLLDRLAGFAPENILDLGAGSAVLSIAAAKLWNRHILATDIDAKSVEIARENADLNNVADRVNVIEADGFEDARIAAAAPFDFVFANILAGPLVEFAPAMAAHIGRAGRVMLAGLMAQQEAKVSEAYKMAGFRLLNRLDHPVWPVLLYART